MSLQEEEEILEICSSITELSFGKESQTWKDKDKKTFDDNRENLLKLNLRYVEENKGELPALHFAAAVSDVDVCRRLVEQGADVNEKCNVRGATPLYYAALNEVHGLSLIDYLFFEKGCDVDGEDARPDQAIGDARRYRDVILAIRKQKDMFNSGNASISIAQRFSMMKIRLIFAKLSFKIKSLDILSEHPSHFSMLESACKFGDLEMCKWLLEDVEIDVNQFEDEYWKDRILQTVAMNLTRETSVIIRYLSSRFEFTADQQSKAFRSAFYYKIVNHEVDIFCAKDAEELFKGFADTKIKIGGQNLLQFCVNRNHLDAAEIVHGKDGELINEIDEDGATILHRAARFGNVEMCQWLIDQGQDIKALNQKTGTNFLHYAAQNSVDGENIIKTFGENLREYVNRTNVHGLRPLHLALINKQRNYKRNAEALLEVGADLSLKIKGYNLLHLCIASKKLDCVKFVHSKNKNLIKERARKGETTLDIAADFYDEEIYAWLVEEGRGKLYIARNQQTSKKKEMTYDDHCENLLEMNLRYVEGNKGDLPALHFAARVSDVDVCRRLVEQGADVNEKCVVRGATPLHYAAMNEDYGLDLINYFIKKGLDIEVKDAHREEAIHYALRAKNYNLVVQIHMHLQERRLRKAAISGVLEYAILNNCLDFAKFIYNNKREEPLSERPRYLFILLQVCQYGDLEMCKWLLEEVKIDVSQFKDKDWKDQILQTVALNRTRETSEIIRYLSSRFEFTADEQNEAYRETFYYKIENEPHQICAKEAEELFKGFADTKIEFEGVNWLQYCVTWCNLDAAKFVHGKYGELINEIDEHGATILHRAARDANVEMCQWLIDQGQDIKALNTKTRANFLHYAAQNSVDGENIIKTFGKNLRGYVNRTNGADVNEKCGVRGATPLHYAAMNETNGLDLIKYFIEKGLDIEVEDAHLCQYGDLEMCKWLLEEVKIDVSQFEDKDWKYQILQTVARNRTRETNAAKFVHGKYEELINEIDEDGATILHLAAMHGNVEMCQWLIDQGQDIYALNKKTGANFLHYAAQNLIKGEDIIKRFGENFRGYVSQTDISHEAIQVIEMCVSLLSEAGEAAKRTEDGRWKGPAGKRKLETEPQTSQENKKMIRYENFMKLKLRYIEENKRDLPALHFAAQISNIDVCLRLVEQGAEVNEKCSPRGATPLHYAAMNEDYGLSLINYFIEKGLNIEVKDAHPCEYGNLEMCKWLLEDVGIDVSQFEDKDWKYQILQSVARNNSCETRTRTLETEQQTSQKIKAMKLNMRKRFESFMNLKLRFVEENKGDLPALHLAARISDVDVCRRLVEQGADVNEKCGARGATPLHYAAMNETNGLDLINYFIEKGLDIEVKDAHLEMAIHYALRAKNYNLVVILKLVCVYGDLEMCKWLLEEVKIDVSQFKDKDWKYQILQTVPANLSLETSKIIRYLSSRFEFTADEQSEANREAFYYKVENEPYQICAKEAEELFKGFANTKIKFEGVNWLQYCVSWGNLVAAKFVHGKYGELTNEIDEDGATILHLAAKHGNVEMCQWLIDQGQDIKALNQKTGANFLHYAAQNLIKGEDIIKKFGENLRGYVNQTDVNDFTPLHFAMLDEKVLFNKSVAEALLELGADLNAKNDGYNFLHLCIVTGDLERVKFVHSKDKNLIKERTGDGKTTLHIAADYYHYGDICAWLVEEGLDPEEITVGGKSVLESISNENAKSFFNAFKKNNYL
ncbi:uncharacterized protein LOC135943808 [Cloeon dipterum]|uniref:uncharacterized protein LOC135943808 n=1 Tax=Cloeon dipterum TaxID=197152 RepID=UPI00321F9CDA